MNQERMLPMKVLYADACIRGELSRTARLAGAFLGRLREVCPDLELLRQPLWEMGLQPLDAGALRAREALCDARDWDSPALTAARAYHDSDLVVIAAPYWDLSFPACVKVWVEHIFVRNLNFVYRNDRPVGLGRARRCVYLTTAGSPIGADDWGAGYLRAALGLLGVRDFHSVAVDGLDLLNARVEALMASGEQRARALAEELAAEISPGPAPC